MSHRVLHLHTLSHVSGSGLNTLATIRGLRDHGFEAELACGGRAAPPGLEGTSASDVLGDEDLLERARAEGIAVHRIEALGRPIAPRADARALVAIARLIRGGGYGVVHTHNSKAGLLGRVAARACRVPAVVHTVHGWAFSQSGGPGRFYRTIERRAARLAHHTILVSHALEDAARAAAIPAADRREVIYSGIDLAAFGRARRDGAMRASLGADDRTFLVGQVSKLWDGKGHETLLRAFGLLRRSQANARLVLVGGGPLRPALERRVVELGLSRSVTFTGHREDVARVTAQLDTATLFSEFEGMGRVVVEALAAGVPVVASRVGGIAELVRSGETGYLVPPGDAVGAGARLARLAIDPALRAVLGAAGRASVDARFDASVMAARIASVYRELLCTFGAGSSIEVGSRARGARDLRTCAAGAPVVPQLSRFARAGLDPERSGRCT